MSTFQEILKSLHKFWGDNDCTIKYACDLEMGAATLHPETFFNCIKGTPFKIAYPQKCIRPSDFGVSSYTDKLREFHQYQVVICPVPENIRSLFEDSLTTIGINSNEHDVQFIDSEWASPAIGASGDGWEIRINGTEVCQFTYFQNMAGMPLGSVAVEIAYGLERLAMVLQKCYKFQVKYSEGVKLGELVKCTEEGDELSYISLKKEEKEKNLKEFKKLKEDALLTLKNDSPEAAYEYTVKASHILDILDASALFLEPERKRMLSDLRDINKRIANAYISSLYKEERTSFIDENISETPAEEYNLPGEFDINTFFFELGYENISTNEFTRDFHAIKGFIYDEMIDALKNFSYKNIDVCCTVIRTTITVYDLEAYSVKVKGSDKDRESLYEMLPKKLTEIFSKIPFSKKMRWNDSGFYFYRPIRSIISMYGRELLPCSIANVHAVKKWCGYLPPLSLQDKIDSISKIEFLDVFADKFHFTKTPCFNRLISSDHIQYLERAYMFKISLPTKDELPKSIVKCLIKSIFPEYIAIECAGYISEIATISYKPMSCEIFGGYQRALTNLASYAKYLKDLDGVDLDLISNRSGEMIIHERVGTINDKRNSMRQSAGGLCKLLNIYPEELNECINYCYADASSNTVREYPDLKGYFGSYLLKVDSSPLSCFYSTTDSPPLRKKTLDAIEHLESRPAPVSDLSAIVTLLDRMDTINRYFKVGLKPTASKDPFALKRAAKDVISCLYYLKKTISIRSLIECTMPTNLTYENQIDREEAISEVYNFLDSRIYKFSNFSNSTSEHIKYIIDAQKNTLDGSVNIYDIQNKIFAFCKARIPLSLMTNIYKRLLGLKKGYDQEFLLLDYPCDGDERELLSLTFKMKNMESMIKVNYGDDDIEHLERLHNDLCKAFKKSTKLIESFLKSAKVDCENKEVRCGRRGVVCTLYKILLSIVDVRKA